jgi:ATP-binding cassette subfamily B protein
MAALLLFSFALLCLEWPLAASALRIGRRLEARLRVAFLEKIPRLGERYFQSRLISDMAERSHSVHLLRRLPELGGRLLRAAFELVFTIMALIWLDPSQAPVAIAVGFISFVLPMLAQSPLTERDLRIRSHNGALSRFYLDAMLGLIALRAHGAEPAVSREHESVLVEWTRSSFGLLRAVLAVEAIQSLAAFGLASWLLLDHLSRGEIGGALLLAYWALNLPALGHEIAAIARQYPSARNVTLRLLEPLGAPEDIGSSKNEQHLHGMTVSGSENHVTLSETVAKGVALSLESVTVLTAGHTILSDVDLRIEAGSHVAIVGPSGAGKSTLVGLLLGWHRAASGRLLLDGQALTSETLAQLRQATAWLDPSIQLWNRSLIENLRYGASQEAALPLNQTIEAADLRSLLEKLPEGFQTRLGEAGGLVSGGEGQRVRFGRALMRSDARLVILDEPFRGLARDQRRALLRRARSLWRDATLLCITHDVSETADFERVLVVKGGRVVEDGNPALLSRQEDSHYRGLLDAEESVRRELWADGRWRRLRVTNGTLVGRLYSGRRLTLSQMEANTWTS